MSLKGHLGTIPLPELLQWLAIGQKTGTLVIVKQEGVHRIVVETGRVVATATSDPAMQLGRRLVESGTIDTETLRRAFKLKEATEMSLGQVLLTLQVVTEDELRDALTAKAEALISRLFHSTDASFHFVEGGDLDDPGLRLSLDATQLVLSAAHNLEEGSRDELPLEVGDEAERTEAEARLAVAPAPPGVQRASATDRETLVEALPETGGRAFGRRRRALGGLAAAAVLIVVLVTVLLVFRQDKPAEAEEAAPGGDVARSIVPLAAGSLTTALRAQEDTASAEGAGTTALEVPLDAPAPELVAPGDGGDGATPAATTAAEIEALLASREEEVRDELDSRYREELAALRSRLAKAEQEADRPAPRETSDATEPAVASPLAVEEREPPASDEDVLAAQIAAEPGIVADPPAPIADANADADAIAVGGGGADGADDAQSPPARVRRVPPRLLDRPAPVYPAAARRLGRGAQVTVRVLVAEDGSVAEAEIASRKAGLGFDRAAIDAARRSRWLPGTDDGVPVSEWVELRFVFKAP